MKNFLTLLSLGLCTSAVMAQGIPVSQNASNRNVLLEEFTGVNCGFCPDGHRIADEIVAANPGTCGQLTFTQEFSLPAILIFVSKMEKILMALSVNMGIQLELLIRARKCNFRQRRVGRTSCPNYHTNVLR